MGQVHPSPRFACKTALCRGPPWPASKFGGTEVRFVQAGILGHVIFRQIVLRQMCEYRLEGGLRWQVRVPVRYEFLRAS